MNRRVWPVIIVLGGCLASTSTAAAAGWFDRWKPADARAAEALEAGDYATVQALMPDSQWSALALDRQGRSEEAYAAFQALREAQADAMSPNERLLLDYNEATAAVRAGAYDEAVALFDSVLERDPQHADAAHNREIAKNLRDQSPPPPQDGDNGGEGQSGTGQNDASSSDQENADSGQGQNGESQSDDASQQSGSQQNSDQSSGQGDGQNEDQGGREEPPTSAEAAADAAREAAEALAAERAAEALADAEPSTDSTTLAESSSPLSESAQAREQWLRRIPDDPAGLLRRKLRQSHMNNYPEVGHSDQPW